MKAALVIITISTLPCFLGSPSVAAESSATRFPTAEARNIPSARNETYLTQVDYARVRDLKFTHVRAADGLAMDNVVSILQDHWGFMWFGTGDGLNRYDGNALLVYKNNPNDPGSLSANFIRDLVEDDHGYLWLAVYPGVNKFDPTTERCTR